MAKKLLIVKYSDRPDVVDCAIELLSALPCSLDISTLYLEQYKNNLSRYYEAIKGYDGIIVGNLAPAPTSIVEETKRQLGLYAAIDWYRKASPTDGTVDMMLVQDSGWLARRDSGIQHGNLGREAYHTEVYSAIDIEKILRTALDLSLARSQSMLLIDNAKHSEVGRLYRATFAELLTDDYTNLLQTVDIADCIGLFATDSIIYQQQPTIATTATLAPIIDNIICQRMGHNALHARIAVGRTTLTMCEMVHKDGEYNLASALGIILACAFLLDRIWDKKELAKNIETALLNALSTIQEVSTQSCAQDVFYTTQECVKLIKDIL